MKTTAISRLVYMGSTASIALIMALSSGVATAQTASSQPEEIVVTARLRKEKIQSVPMSINVMTEKTIRAAGITNVADVARLTPGFTYAPLFGGSAATPVIRGQSTTIGEPNVGFFIDGVYQSSRVIMDAALGDDVARVEVVKGPQSSLYGHNTFGGAVNIISRTPTGLAQGRFEIELADHNASTLRGNLSGPIIENQLYYRVGVLNRRSDGFFNNTVNGGNLDSRDTTVFSGMLYATPSDTLNLKIHLAHETTRDGDNPLKFATNNSFPANVVNPANPAFIINQMFTGELLGATSFGVTPGYNNRDYTAFSTTVEKNFGATTFTSITGIDRLDYDQGLDGDYRATAINYQKTHIKLNDFSQEFRLSSNSEGSVNWLIGAYYYKADTLTHVNNDYGSDALNIITTTGAAGFSAWRRLLGGGVSDVSETTENKALFGALNFKMSDSFRVSLQGRYTQETKTADSIAKGGLLNPTGPVTTTFNASRKFNNFSPRLTLEFDAAKDIMIFASAAKGEKSGGFNTNIITGSPIPSERNYDPESAWNYELGIKTTSPDGRFVFNAAAFQIDWKDQIVRAIGASGALLNVNAGQTTVKGAEFEMRAHLMDGLDINAGLAYTDSKYDKYNFSILSVIGINPNLAGTRLQYVSKWQSNISAQYVVPISGNVKWFNRIDYSYQSDQSSVQPANAYVGDATIVNMRTGIDYKNISIRLFALNVLEEDSALTGAFVTDPGQQYDFVRGAVGMGPLVGRALFGGVVVSRTPRSFGVSLSLKY